MTGCVDHRCRPLPTCAYCEIEELKAEIDRLRVDRDEWKAIAEMTDEYY